MSLTDSSLERRLQRYTRQDGDCLRWIGVRNSGGYGRLSVNGKAKSAHRVAYELWVGAIPDGLEIDHLCRVRDCVRPEHLRAVTHSENVRRSIRNLAPKCRRGHVLSNVSIRVRNGRKYRVCRACKGVRNRAYKAQRRRTPPVLDGAFGQCGICRRWFIVRLDGLLWKHGNGKSPRGVYCLGSSTAPVARKHRAVRDHV